MNAFGIPETRSCCIKRLTRVRCCCKRLVADFGHKLPWLRSFATAEVAQRPRPARRAARVSHTAGASSTACAAHSSAPTMSGSWTASTVSRP